MVWKEKKEFTSDLKNIYNAPTKEAAKMELENFEQKWGIKYPYAIRSWRNNWEELTVFFDFPVEIRKIIYTTNLIENLNGKIRKYTKNKLSFPNDDALKKSVYLAIKEIEKKWYQPIWNWALIFNQFITIFENRIQVLYLNPEVFYLHKMMDSIEYYLGVSVKSQLSATEPVIDIFSTPFNVNT